MIRIKSIHINNFKFFPEFESIHIGGKNILLFGENGSGKSSIYWALYTLLESSEKNDSKQIQKYFIKNKDESLVNIHAVVNNDGIDNSFVKVTLEDDTEFEVSYQNTAINNNQQAKESLLASDFLNYRLLQQTHNVRHSQEIDMFSMFEEAVFRYVQFPPVNWHDDNGIVYQLTNAGSIWKIIFNGPEKKYPTKAGKPGFPSKSAHNSAFKEFYDLNNGFNTGLSTLIQKINTTANPILKNKLGYNITFRLDLLVKKDAKLTVANYVPPVFKIKLLIEDLDGNGSIIKPQSFLNEARLSAISLSIRLAILEERLPDSIIKILVLDDLMISLDMSNRARVTKLILNEYAWQFDAISNVDKGHQTFILTHDRSLFTFIKNDIANLPLEKANTWNFIEMYADDVDENDPNSFEKPKLFYEQNDLAIAVKHYKQHDYPAAANYLRKYSEEILCKWLPEYCWKDKECKDKSNNKMPLRNIVENSLNVFWPLFGITCNEYLQFRKYLIILLNPLSHADVGVERYKEEIKQVIKIIQGIETLHSTNKLEVIIAGGEVIQIRQTSVNGDLYIGNYELADSLYKLTNAAGNMAYSTFEGRIISWEKTETNGTITNGQFNNKTKKQMNTNHSDFVILNTLTGSANWMDDLYKTDGTKLI